MPRETALPTLPILPDDLLEPAHGSTDEPSTGSTDSSRQMLVPDEAWKLLEILSEPVFLLSERQFTSGNGAAVELLSLYPQELVEAAVRDALANSSRSIHLNPSITWWIRSIPFSRATAVVLSLKHPGEAPVNQSLKEEVRELLNSTGLPFAIFDKDLCIRYWSTGAAQVIPRESVLNKYLEDAFDLSAVGKHFYRQALQSTESMVQSDLRTVDARLPKSLKVTAIPMAGELLVFYENNDPLQAQLAAVNRSTERFRRLSDSLSVALIMLNGSLNVSYWNAKAEELTTLKKDEVLGRAAREVFPLVSLDLSLTFLRALETKTPFQIERLRYKDKNVNGYFGVRAFIVDDELAVLIEDKTEQVRGEEQLRASEERFRTVSENMSLAFVLIDMRGRVAYWNKMCEVTFGGVASESALGRDALEVLPLGEATLSRLLSEARTSAEGVKLRVLPERDGIQSTYDVRAFAVGEEVGILFEDVTLQVRQAVELDRTNQQLLDLYQNAPCGYLSVWPDGSIERINQRMIEWLGMSSPAEAIDTPIQRLLTEASSDALHQQIAISGLEAPITNLELEFRRAGRAAAERETFWGLVNALPIHDPVVRRWYWRWTVVDITELRDAQKQIEDNRLFSQLFNELGEAVLISDKHGMIIRANKAASRILGISEEDLTKLNHDSPVWQAVLEDGTPIPTYDLPAVRALREKRPVSNLEIGVVRPDGKLTWILESAAPLFDEDGEVTGVIVTFPEVTATVMQRQTLKDLNEKYQIERDRANEANRLKSSFLANMSHEIRTPMTAILGFSDILAGELSGKVSEQHYTFLRSINVSGKRLLNLINDILDLSKIEAGRLELHTEELDVASEIEASVTPLSWIAKQKGLAVNVQSHAERLFIRGDRQRFSQVLTNIISNGIKFTRAGSITIRTILTPNLQTGSSQVVIEVEDTGIGISKDFLPYLFEEFRQEHTGVTKEFGGTGLGLAISRRLVSLMGGSMHVRSQQGVGTVFSLLFPLEAKGKQPVKSAPVVPPMSAPLNVPVPAAVTTGTAAPSKERSEGIPTHAPGTAKPGDQESPAERKHVLVVEDNPETQRLLEVYLKNTYRVSQAMNADEAFAVIEKDIPDFILMDVNLPMKDGLTITREIRQGTICPNVPIVALTAFAMTGDRQRCLDAGCNDYLSKPATKREVLEVISRLAADKE